MGIPKIENLDKTVDFEFIPYVYSDKEKHKHGRSSINMMKSHLIHEFVN